MKLEQQLRETIRMQNLADSTADAYWFWCEKFLLFAKAKRGQWVHPSELREPQVEIWLKHLANKQNVSANTQNQAFSALCYLYRHVLRAPLENVSAMRAKRPDRVRDVLDQSELVELFAELRGPALLAARMMYASSFRIGEIGHIRIKDISFERRQVVIRGAKGDKDRIVGFPPILHDAVRLQIESMRVLWKCDCAEGRNGVSLPNRFGSKSPSSHREFAWYYLLSSDNESKCPQSGKLYRHHQDMGHIARQIKLAAAKCGFAKRVTSHCLRHSFATHSLENGVPIHVVQKLLGHADIKTTERYLHMSKHGATAAQSPLEVLELEPVREASPMEDALRNPPQVFKPRLFKGA
jgi:integron integrase